MNPARPLLVNGHEVNTDKALERAAEAAGYRIARKVRVADVLPIANSGLSNAEYRYALRSHFDWVVTEGEERTRSSRSSRRRLARVH